MSVLGKNAIMKLLSEEKLQDRLIVTPLLEQSQVGPSSIDIRIGYDFAVTKTGSVECINPAAEDTTSQHQHRHRKNLREPFYLHPRELVLASTLEYFRLPKSVSGYVTSRSSWGRVGLIIATATIIHPGYDGVITLELLNLGKVPICLYPGISVAQLVLHRCESAEEYSGRFSANTTTMTSNFESKEQENSFWIRKPQKVAQS